MSILIHTILYIISHTLFTHAQNLQTMAPQESCVPSSILLRCPSTYAVVVRNAFYGISQTPSLCVYTPGDCIADAVSSVSCLIDSNQCSFYATKRKLSQCNDQLSSYFHIEYDCVPTLMNDTSKNYQICQDNTEITTDNGIIRSPGYPSPFQTTTSECFRAIHVPNTKIIRLWLTDLFIGSTSTNCADDHVYVVDNIRTYRHCGHRRYAYPYLCSSTIMIQYLVKTNLLAYRGMRMYFEIVDRPSNDACPQVTVTPIPSITATVTTLEPTVSTSVPVYVTLGLASPIRNFQMCVGKKYLNLFTISFSFVNK